MHVASNSLYITISRMVWGFYIQPPLDANGKEIIPGTLIIEDT